MTIPTANKTPLLGLLQQVCGEIGLVAPGSVIGNSDQQVVQLLSLMYREGREQFSMGTPIDGWQALRQEHVFNLVAAQDTYPLPADYDHMIPQTIWDRGFRWQMVGPMSPQEWQVLKSGLSPTGPRRRFRLIDDAFVVDPVPTDTNQIVFEYYSSSWVLSQAGAPQKTFLADTDFFALDDDAFVLGAIWRFRRAKGLDYDEEKAMWQDRVDLVISRQAGQRALALNNMSRDLMLLSGANVPDTGFGA